MIDLRQPLELVNLSQRLRLRPADTARLFASFYFSRGAVLWRMYQRDTLVIELPWRNEVLKPPIRVNASDYKLLGEIFAEHVCRLDASNVSTIVDLEANIGMATAYLGALFPGAEFACVEPSPASAEILRNTLSLNRIRSRVFEAAIGLTSGTAALHLADRPTSASLVPADPCSTTVQVRQMTMRELMEEMGWKGIDVLKMGIDGYERFLLTQDNSWLHSVRFILGEWHAHMHYPYSEMEGLLREFGFQLERRSGNEETAIAMKRARTAASSVS